MRLIRILRLVALAGTSGLVVVVVLAVVVACWWPPLLLGVGL